MKQALNVFLITLLAGAIFTSCQKVGDLPAYQNATPAVLTASATTLAPARTDSTKSVLTVNWTYPNHATSDPNSIKYTIDIDSVGKNFSNPLTKVVIGSLSTSFLAKDFNDFFLAKGYTPGVATNLEMRVTSSYGNNNERVNSNTVSLKYTPYAIRVIVSYAFPKALWIAGNFQNWAPATAPQIVDVTATGTTGTNYEGYINFNNASPEFKMVKGNDWSAGDFGAAGVGQLGGGDNIKLPTAGVYRIKANTVAKTWSFDKIDSWGIIGDATPGGWSSSTAMTLNADGTYSITATLTTGEFKFRANNSWDINFGDNKAGGGPDNVPEYGGDNIAITSAGNYIIMMDLTKAGNYYYTVRKL